MLNVREAFESCLCGREGVEIMPRRRRAKEGDGASSQGGDDAVSSVGGESKADGAEADEFRNYQNTAYDDRASDRSEGGALTQCAFVHA